MTYSINVNGSKDTASAEESLAFEREQADKARAAIATLEGVSSAKFYGENIGSVDLLQPAATPTDAGGDTPST